MHGGMTEYPRIFPLAIAMAVTFAAYTTFGRRVIASYDRVMANAGPFIVTVLFLYALIPSFEHLVRHIDIIATVAFGLPLVYATPYFAGSNTSEKTALPDTVYDEAYMASKAAYSKTKPAGPDITEYEYVQNVDTGARSGIFSSPNRIVIAFSGSDSKTDWLKTNMDGRVDEETGIHEGFLKAWTSIKDKVLTLAGDMLIRNGGGKNVTVLVTGHSLGGALAEVSALDILATMDRPLTVVTFGAPPIGTSKFTTTFDQQISDAWRVFTVHDPVPKLIVGTLEHPLKARKVVLAPPTATAFTAHDMIYYERQDKGSMVTIGVQAALLACILIFFNIRS